MRAQVTQKGALSFISSQGTTGITTGGGDRLYTISFDSSRIVRTGTKTRPEHTHFALRLVSY